MSVVTTVIISGYLTDDERKYVSDFEHRGERLPFTRLDPCGAAGGKCAEVDLRWGAHNYFDHEAFLDHLDAKQDWYEVSEIVVIVSSSDIGFTTVWRPGSRDHRSEV